MSGIRFVLVIAALGTLLLSACGAAQKAGSVNPDGSVNVTITLNDFTIESSVTQFKTGVPYHFTITNEGQVGHEFMILPASGQTGMSGMAGMPMEDLDKLALMMVPIEQLPAGATVKADYIFTGVPNGKIEMACYTKGHYEAGMHIPITVQ